MKIKINVWEMIVAVCAISLTLLWFDYKLAIIACLYGLWFKREK